MSLILSFLVVNILMISSACGQPEGFNYDEAKVPDFTLPDPLLLENGNRVADAGVWKNTRRAEIVRLFETCVYGRAPADCSGVRFGDAEVEDQALGGVAVRKQLKVYFGGGQDGPAADLLIYLPAHGKAPSPVFVGLNFAGNPTVAGDTGIWLPARRDRSRDADTHVPLPAAEQDRGTSSSRWPIPEIVARGYAVATMYCGDIDPDYDDGFRNGVHPLFFGDGQNRPASDEWGTLAAWAWGLSRAMDYFETDDDINHRRVAVLGHSRLGKAALWAGAQDERFALVISNDSGCGGAALSRRRFGETIQRINTSFPHWFCRNFHHYSDNEAALPVDQHMLAALIAPRPLYVASAEQDLWADPRGEFLSLQLASPVYELFGKQAIGDLEMPAVDSPLLRDVAYHIRSGKHDITRYDWHRFLDFADQQFGGEQ